ncbi:predicted protein, partial [Arabidopsis lyrata subsp. lyrata]
GYAIDGNKCLIWTKDVLNLHQLDANKSEGSTFYLRVAASNISSQTSDEEKNHRMDIFGGEDDDGDQIELRLSEILVATNNFSDENKLGEGGFGSVYKVCLTVW